MRQGKTHDKDKMVLRALEAEIEPGDFGSPMDPSDAQIDICMYDANGYFLGGGLTPGDANWKAIGSGGFSYRDPAQLAFGVKQAKFKVTGIRTGLILAKGKGSRLRLPEAPLTAPIVAQAKNDDTGACWQIEFEAEDIKRNDGERFLAQLK